MTHKMTRREWYRLCSFAVGGSSLVWMTPAAVAGPAPHSPARVQHTLHGTVIAVDQIAQSLTVQARRLETWMEGVKGTYHVDNVKVLREVKAGDQIMGKLFEGETALHHVQIVAISVPTDIAPA